MNDFIYKLAQAHGLSDIHIQTDLPVATRINGSIVKHENNIISKNEVSKFLTEHLNKELLDKLNNEKNAIKIMDMLLLVSLNQK